MEKSFIIRPRTEGNILKRFCFNLLCSCKKRMLRNLTDPQMRKKLAVIVQLESVHGYSFSEFPMTILLFFLSFFFFVLLREKYRTHSLRFDTKVPAVFFSSISQLLLIYRLVRSQLDGCAAVSSMLVARIMSFLLRLCKQNSVQQATNCGLLLFRATCSIFNSCSRNY